MLFFQNAVLDNRYWLCLSSFFSFVYVEENITMCQIVIKNSLYIILVTLYAILCVLLVLAVVHVLCLPVWGIFSHDLSFTIYTWSNLAHFLLLTVRLAVGIVAFCLGAPLHTMLNGMAIFVIGAALVLQIS